MTTSLIRAGQAVLTVLSTTLLLAVSGPASAAGTSNNTVDQTAPPDDRIVVDVVTVNGSGCPAGTATVSTSPDNTAFRVRYQRYVARAGAHADPIDFRKNCQINLAIHIPQGFTYAIARAEYRGFARLRSDADGLMRAAYYFQGSSDTLYVDHSLTGPFSNFWHFTDVTPVAALVFAPCGRNVNLNVNTELRVHAGAGHGATSFMSMSSTEGDIDTIYHFHWRRCN